jgi:hypothetical protein
MELSCPRCGKDFVRRAPRKGVLEQLLSLAYIYPFRCQLCTHRFRAMEWGKRYEKHTSEKRQYERIPANIPSSFSGGEQEGTAVVTDLSMGGCGMETNAPCTEGALVELRLHTSDQTPPITIEAAVVRSVRGKFAGLQFLRFQPQDKDRLSQLIRELMVSARR